MKNEDFEKIIKEERLLYEYVAGSHLYGLQMEDGSSDVDTKGIYLAPKEELFGLRDRYHEQISDARNDNTWFELGRYCELILKSNPTVMEALFVPQSKFITPPSDILMPLFENRDPKTIYDITILTCDNIDKKLISNINSLKEDYGDKFIKIAFINMKNDFRGAITGTHISTAAYYRIAFPSLLPNVAEVAIHRNSLFILCRILSFTRLSRYAISVPFALNI